MNSSFGLRAWDFSDSVFRVVGFIVSLKQIEYGVYEHLTIIYPKPHVIYLKGDYRA